MRGINRLATVFLLQPAARTEKPKRNLQVTAIGVRLLAKAVEREATRGGAQEVEHSPVPQSLHRRRNDQPREMAKDGCSDRSLFVRPRVCLSDYGPFGPDLHDQKVL